MKFTKIRVILAVIALELLAIAFLAGRWSASSEPSLADDYAAAAAFVQQDKDAPSFCDLNERARMLVCPAQRRVLSLSTGGHIVLYKCRHDGTAGYAELVNVDAETRILLRAQTPQQGVRLRKICERGDSEVYRITSRGSPQDA